ncbi:MAG: hypothetical protein OHK0011_22040 [Turneriella sp.]
MIRPASKPLSRSLFFAAFVGVAYGIAAQFLARTIKIPGPDDESAASAFMVMSVAYVFVLPAIIGMVHVWVRSREGLISYGHAIAEPLLPITLCLGVSMLIGWEGTICLIMAIPVMLPLAMAGGLAMRIILNLKNRNLVFAAFTIMPLPLAMAEQLVPLPQEMQVVRNSVLIEAPAEVIWRKIVRVEKITESQESPFFTMGFPKPIEAVLSGDGVGQTRLATFERGLQFVETVTDWKVNEKLGFTIKADPKATPLTTLDEHVTVGGAFFDVLSGTYEIRRLNASECELILYSQHRISTHFNFYARLWSRYLMSEIQWNILQVIKQRAEKEKG